MQDISEQLSEIIKDKQCSSLLAFIVVKDGLYIQESKSDKQSGRGLCDKGDIPTNR